MLTSDARGAMRRNDGQSAGRIIGSTPSDMPKRNVCVDSGSILFVEPSFISTAFGFGDVTSNVPLLAVTRLYGKLFITVGLLAVVATLLIAVNMLVTGVVAYGMTKNVTFLYADLARGVVLLALLYAYHYRYYRPSRERLRMLPG